MNRKNGRRKGRIKERRDGGREEGIKKKKETRKV